MTREDENGVPADAAMREFVARLAALAPDARDAVIARMWDGRRTRDQLARAVEELRTLMPWPARPRFASACRPAIDAWSGPEQRPIVPPWLGPETWQALTAAGYDGVAPASGWTSNAVVLATAAVHHRAALSRASLAVLYYPFEPAVSLASLDAAFGALPDPLAPTASAPPRVPPARLATIDRIVDFVRNAPLEALEDLVSAFARERGMLMAVGDGAAGIAERELKAALARTGLEDEATFHLERVREAQRARDDAFHLPDPKTEPGASVGQDVVILVGVAMWALQATLVGEALGESSRGQLTHTLLEHLTRHEREVREGRRPAILPPRRAPRRFDAPLARMLDPTPDTWVWVPSVRIGGRVVYLLAQSRERSDVDARERLMLAPDGTIPAFARRRDAADHIRQFFPPPRWVDRDTMRWVLNEEDAPERAKDLDRVLAMRASGWEATFSFDEMVGVWRHLVMAGLLPPIPRQGASVSSSAGLDDADAARALAARLHATMKAGSALRPPEWDLDPALWPAEELAVLARLVRRGVQSVAERIRIVEADGGT